MPAGTVSVLVAEPDGPLASAGPGRAERVGLPSLIGDAVAEAVGSCAGLLADPAEQAGRFELVRLFAERARQARPRFTLTWGNSRNTCPIYGRRGRVVGRCGK
jgi:hypothetical protein